MFSSHSSVPRARTVASSSTVKGLRATATQRSTNFATSTQAASMLLRILSYTLLRSGGKVCSFCRTCEVILVLLRSSRTSETYRNVPPAFSVRACLIICFVPELYLFFFDNSSTLSSINLDKSLLTFPESIWTFRMAGLTVDSDSSMSFSSLLATTILTNVILLC